MNPVRAPVAIVGMHRSGTSCLTGTLQEAGLYLGEVNTAAPNNARGNRENRAIMDLHEAVLVASGGSWSAPPVVIRWDEQQQRHLRQLVAAYPADVAWGFKDPRTLMLLDAWLAAIPNLRLVGSLRHPASVAASLRRRDKFSWEQGYALWLEYNRRLLARLEERRFPLVSFDLAPPAYRAALVDVIEALGLREPPAGLRFFNGALRNQRPEDYPPLPDEVEAVYHRLLEFAA